MNGGKKVRHVPFAALARAHRELQGEIEAVNWLLEKFRQDLPSDSATAKAIDRKAPWREILQFALWEDCYEVAGLLEDALETFGGDLPPNIAGH